MRTIVMIVAKLLHSNKSFSEMYETSSVLSISMFAFNNHCWWQVKYCLSVVSHCATWRRRRNSRCDRVSCFIIPYAVSLWSYRHLNINYMAEIIIRFTITETCCFPNISLHARSRIEWAIIMKHFWQRRRCTWTSDGFRRICILYLIWTRSRCCVDYTYTSEDALIVS